MGKLTASSVLGLVAVPSTPDPLPISTSSTVHVRTKTVVETLVVAAVSAATFAALATLETATMPTSRFHDDVIASQPRSNAPVFCGTDRPTQPCILHAVRPSDDHQYLLLKPSEYRPSLGDQRKHH